MDRSLLDSVTFKSKGIKLPKPTQEKISNPVFKSWLLREAFYFFIVCSILFGGKLFIEYTVAFVKGEPHQSIQVLWKDYQDFRRSDL